MNSSRLRFALLCASCLLAGCGDDGAQMMPAADLAIPPAADLVPPPAAAAARTTAIHYEVALDLPTRIATTRVTLRVDQPGNCVTIGFRAGAPSDVKLDGVPASPGETVTDTMAGTMTACRAGHALWAAGEKAVLSVTAEIPKSTIGASQVGFSTRSDANGKPFSYLVSWINGCDHHGPCDAAPDRFATYKFVVTSADGEQVLCPGTITVNGKVTTCDFQLDGGGPTYSTFGVAAGRSWTPKSLGSWDGIDVTLYDYPQTQIGAAFDTAIASKHMAWMQSLLGPYPYGKALRLVVAPTYWLGFEHPGNIVLAQNLVTQKAQLPWSDSLRHVTMHEVAHQWAGDHATLAGTYDFFWKEATAEYLTYVFEEEQIAPAEGRVTLEYWKSIAAASRYYPVPGEKPPLFTYYGDAYGEGPMVLYRQLEVMYSREKVLAAAKKLLSSSGPPRAVSVDDFRRGLEASLGTRLTGYFDAWMRGTGAPAWPTAKITTTDMGGGDVKVAVDVNTADGVPRGCAFKVRLHEAGGMGSYDVPVNLGPDGARFTPVVVKPGFVVASAELDPLSECLIYPSSGLTRPRPPVTPWVAPGN